MQGDLDALQHDNAVEQVSSVEVEANSGGQGQFLDILKDEY